MKTFIPILAVIVLLFCQMDFKIEKNKDFSVLRIDTPKVQKDEILENPVRRAQFKGGDLALKEFITKNLQYPPDYGRICVEGTVYVRFIIDKDGSVMKDCVKIGKSLEKNLDKEAIRVIKLMPNWTPATQNGRYVRQRLRVPVKFKIGK